MDNNTPLHNKKSWPTLVTRDEVASKLRGTTLYIQPRTIARKQNAAVPAPCPRMATRDASPIL
jgi:hypothetical protein